MTPRQMQVAAVIFLGCMIVITIALGHIAGWW
jgi:hypothetical protein